ncbi:hypothetical protein M409DRAFT_70648 [Zasmidium cellare ATCC 36951]|uniref:DNA (cytosine-5-)-methyltransferase n=1 Tax=Zasmidium cellare ATCC 36951 TaxID=1080233 RepID=A0A6A6BZ86_ZASCE|nr:uncharacterized protein M409DRAFT_70648 [Zasmidium cellare ATCC 36951]KAF2160114.1 hypothetical protein M409DRAFT_70648 [Zasmidium cellare ATCC 36951]
MCKRCRFGRNAVPYDIVDILSDEESDVEYIPKRIASSSRRVPIQVNEDEDQEAIDLTGDDDDDFIRELTPNELKTIEGRDKTAGSVLPGFRLISNVTTSHGLHISTSLEEPTEVELPDGDFLRVLYIYQHLFTREVILKGILLRRVRRVHRYYKKNRNELCAILQQNRDMEDLTLDSSLVTRSLGEVVQIRNIVFTNADFPSFSFRSDPQLFGPHATANNKNIEDTAVLVCRFKYIECCNAANGKVMMEVLLDLREHEADKGKGVSDLAKKQRWLSGGEKQEVVVLDDDSPKSEPMDSIKKEKRTSLSDVPAHQPFDKKRKIVVDLTSDDESEEVTEQTRKTFITDTFKRSKLGGGLVQRRERTSVTSFTKITKSRSSSVSSIRTFGRGTAVPVKPYTYGDICAGAGGMARGAADHGFVVNFLLDHWSTACDTLRRNWPRAKVLEASIFDFCTKLTFQGYMRVDILHISFPCQTHSLAHTRPGKDDDANEAAALSVGDLLRKCRPRVVTFEQTWSILIDRRRPHFQALVHQLTSMGYNVRWKVLICSEYGNVQPRKRLFVIASCPGEPLPPFPKPTHGPGRKPFVTIRDRLALIPQSVLPHMQQHTKKDAAPYNPNRVLRAAITCDGGQGDVHPSGKRSFNMQELASLAGFPPRHQFTGFKTAIRKQIGNAVPSMVAKSIFQDIEKSMRQADRDEEVRDAQLRREDIEID